MSSAEQENFLAIASVRCFCTAFWVVSIGNLIAFAVDFFGGLGIATLSVFAVGDFGSFAGGSAAGALGSTTFLGERGSLLDTLIIALSPNAGNALVCSFFVAFFGGDSSLDTADFLKSTETIRR